MAEDASLLGLTGRRVLVIGGGQGMGEATARHVSRAGADVALVDLVAERAEAVAAMVRANGRRAVTILGDVLEDAQIPRIVAEAEAGLGGIDALVSIVGAARWGSLMETTGADWDAQMALNLRYFFLVSKAVAGGMIRRGTGGCILGIASVDGQRASPMRGAYGAAKAGLISLVQTMAVEWAPHGIRANAIAPGHIVTPRLYDTPHRQEAYAASLIPLRRRGTIEEIGKAALFLVSDLASYVNGTVLDVDGGQLAANLFPGGLPGANG